jgi:Domain of unknown function (DUF397)
MGDFKWIRSSYSSAEAANCVEITVFPNGGRAVRDSKNPEGAVLVLTGGQWAQLINSLLLRECTKQPPDRRGSGVSRFLSGRNPHTPGKQVTHESLLELCELALSVFLRFNLGFGCRYNAEYSILLV